MGVGAGASYVAVISSSQPDGSRLSSHILDLTVPLYISQDYSETFGLYLSPKYILRTFIRTADPEQHFAGGTVGVRWGNRFGILAEATYLRDINNAVDIVQGTGALFVGGEFYPTGTLFKTSVPVPDGGARVLRYFSQSRTVLTSHPRGSRWVPGHRACVWRQGLERACGKVISTSSRDARIRLDFMEWVPRPGDRVERAR